MPLGSLTTWLLLLAVFGTAVFVIRVIMMFTGVLSEGAEGDVGMDGDFGDVGDAGDIGDTGGVDAPDGTHDSHHSTCAFQVLNLQTLSAFFMGAGWFGLAALRGEMGFDPHPGLATLIGAGCGVLLAWLQFWLLRKLLKLQSRGARFDPHDAVGKVGQVYMRIPEQESGTGKIRVGVSGSMRILPAVSEGAAIESFKSVSVTSIRPGGTLVVVPVEA